MKTLRTLSLLAVALSGAVPLQTRGNEVSSTTGTVTIRVGVEEGDFRGNDNRVLQGAIDYVSRLGGGTVSIAPGRFLMRNALILRDRINVVGVPGKTILAACDGIEVPLAADGDCNERQITLQDASGFRVGDGVSIQDQRKGGFEVTTATLTEQIDAKTFRISAPLYLDYMVSDKATARLVFPVVGGWNVTNVLIDGLTIEGNRAHAQPLNGCRGGGIFLFECDSVAIRNCTVRNYNGDGISFQVSQHVTVEDCLSEKNAGLGLHPGSGSQHPIVKRNVSVQNGSDGLYVCWRVKYGVFEANQLRDNQGAGISIGHKDSDNLFRENSITGNVRTGVLFREEIEAMGAHRNVFEKNVILDNGIDADGKFVGDPIIIRGTHRDLQFRENKIGFTKLKGAEHPGIAASKQSEGLRLEDNQFENVRPEVARSE